MLLILVPEDVDEKLHPDFFKKVSTLPSALRQTLLYITGGDEMNVLVQTWNGPHILAILMKKKNSLGVHDIQAVGEIIVAMNSHLRDIIHIEVLSSDHTATGDTFSGVVQIKPA